MILAALQVCPFPHLSWWAQYLHPGQLRTPCGGYWAWSGILSDLGEVTLIAAVVTLLQRRNCHVNGCWRLGHADPVHGFPVCLTHSVHSASLGIPHEKLPPLPPETP